MHFMKTKKRERNIYVKHAYGIASFPKVEEQLPKMAANNHNNTNITFARA